MSTVKSTNPYNGSDLESYEHHTDEQVEAALKAADRQFSAWRKTSLQKRNEFMIEFGALLRSQKEDLAKLATLEMGKPIEQSISEIEKCADLCDYYADKSTEFLKNKVVQESNPQKFISYQPIGCVLAIMPWNYPFWQVIRFLVPTVLAGNVALLKHASNVTGCALKIEELMAKAGFGKGVFQTLIVSSDKIEKIIENKIVKAVSLTGSEPAGSAVAQTAGRKIKKFVLELGGSDPYIIMPDADLDLAAEKSVQARLQNNGQTCIAAKRFIVHENVYDEFKQKIMDLCDQKKFGDPLDKDTDMGPLATSSLADELKEQIAKSVKQGAQLIYEKKPNEDSNGTFAPITILEDIPKSSPAYTDELFGPAFLLFKFSDLDEALSIANDTEFGLGGGVFTSDIEKGREIAEVGIESGSVSVNDFTKSDPEMPFGGVKKSGVGRELSFLGIHEFVNIKTIVVNT